MKQRIVVLLGIALLAGAGTAIACSDKTDTKSLENRIATLEAQDQTGATAAQNASMAQALTALSAAGIHEFVTSVDAGTVPPGETGPLRIALAAIAAAQWPADLQADAQDMQDKLSALLEVLHTGDIEQIKGPADEAHEANDAFPGMVYAMLAESLGLPTPEASEH